MWLESTSHLHVAERRRTSSNTQHQKLLNIPSSGDLHIAAYMESVTRFYSVKAIMTPCAQVYSSHSDKCTCTHVIIRVSASRSCVSAAVLQNAFLEFYRQRATIK